MPPSLDSDAPRIFFSYAGEDKFWVQGFKKSTGFENVGVVRVLDYAAEEVGFGDLGDRLDEQIHKSAVVIAFVSSEYCKKKWTVAEWEETLTDAQRRRLIFVPIMLDADAITWWRKSREDGKLGALTRDYAYVSFIDAGGSRFDIRPEDTLVNGKIARLALQIRQELENNLPPQTVQPIRPPAAEPSAARSGGSVVVLGHPAAALPQEMASHIRNLCAGLKSRHVQTESWRDGWRKKSDARGSASGLCDPIFVQPVADTEAADFAADPAIIGKYLDGVGFPTARVVLWLPDAFSDRDFSDAVARTVHSRQFPALRADPSEALAQWLHGFEDQAAAIDETKIQIKTIGISDESTAAQMMAPLRIIDQLKSEIIGIATKFVDNPQPTPPPWEFWGENFSEQLKRLPGSRTIIAIHDLDVAPASGGSIEKQLQARFDEILEAVDREQEARAKAGKPPLNPFLAALLVRSASELPFNEYPYDGRYGQWRLLGFAPPNGAGPGEPAFLKPNPDSLAVFRQKLFSWAHPAPQPLQ
jgi:TIR domain